MKIIFEQLKQTNLFFNFNNEELESILNCIEAKVKTYEKGNFIATTNDKITEVGIVISGSIQLFKEDYWGNKVIVETINENEIFGESYISAKILKLPINILATKNSKIIFINNEKIFNHCCKSCPFHIKLIQNMVNILANKNILLNRKITHLTQHTTRDKLLSYLSEQAMKSKNKKFEIPYNREELAQFLAIDRSAMSSALSKLKKDGIIDFDKNVFELFTI